VMVIGPIIARPIKDPRALRAPLCFVGRRHAIIDDGDYLRRPFKCTGPRSRGRRLLLRFLEGQIHLGLVGRHGPPTIMGGKPDRAEIAPKRNQQLLPPPI